MYRLSGVASFGRIVVLVDEHDVELTDAARLFAQVPSNVVLNVVLEVGSNDTGTLKDGELVVSVFACTSDELNALNNFATVNGSDESQSTLGVFLLAVIGSLDTS